MGCQGTLLFADKKYNPIHIHGGNLESMCKPRMGCQSTLLLADKKYNFYVGMQYSQRAQTSCFKLTVESDN